MLLGHGRYCTWAFADLLFLELALEVRDELRETEAALSLSSFCSEVRLLDLGMCNDCSPNSRGSPSTGGVENDTSCDVGNMTE